MERTDVIEVIKELWECTEASKRGRALKALQKTIPDEHQVFFGEFASHLFNNALDTKESHIIILIHGIHTNGSWQQDVQEQMDGVPHLRVQKVGYELVTGLQFAFLSRSSAIKKVLHEIRTIKREEPIAKLSIIAHSFGTYITSKIIATQADLRFEKIITCGSVMPRDYNWVKHAPYARHGDIINDVGTNDWWPIAANCFSLGYGASGNQGFQSAAVVDRYFEYGHSDFFEPENDHIRKFWRPIFEKGSIPASPSKLPKANLGRLWLCHSIKGKYIPFGLYTLIGAGIIYSSISWAANI
ncbi:hypothetical protein PPUJ20066_07950 [Pseudomonas putida]|nr:hypothetical protein PPUJ20066_07950 [Pseudomonas putida]